MKILAVRSSIVAVVFRKVGGELLPQPGNTGAESRSSLEDCMEERQHHLNESSSARLRRSQKLEILPSPNSKSLGAYICGCKHLS